MLSVAYLGPAAGACILLRAECFLAVAVIAGPDAQPGLRRLRLSPRARDTLLLRRPALEDPQTRTAIHSRRLDLALLVRTPSAPLSCANEPPLNIWRAHVDSSANVTFEISAPIDSAARIFAPAYHRAAAYRKMLQLVGRLAAYTQPLEPSGRVQ